MQEAGRLTAARKGSPGRTRNPTGPPGNPAPAGAGRMQANLRGGRTFPPRRFQRIVNSLYLGILASMFTLTLGVNAASAGPPGQLVSNQARVDYLNTALQPSTATSNIVDVVTAVIRTASGIELTRVLGSGVGAYQEPVGPSACFQGGAFVTLADPILLGGGTIDPTSTRDVVAATSFNLGETIFIRLADADQNVDFAVIDTAVVDVVHDVTGDTETIRLSETGVDTGVFAGYVPTANAAPASGDCVLQGGMGSSMRVTYTDPADPADAAVATARLDPLSRVFESRTGSPIDGTTIQIVDAVSGLPATVYGNDGVSIFPSAITAGATETDSSGTMYVFGSGEFRFPVVPPGSYQLITTPPGTYSAPSVANVADLQSLPGAPYSLGPASFGTAFTQTGQTSVDFDIPVDPLASALFLQKTTLTTIASPGDFVRYELSVENTSSNGIASNVRVIDLLPAGVRFVPGSVTYDGTGVSDPLISPDMTTLEFAVGDIAAGQRVRIQYVVEVTTGVRGDELVNSATAHADGGLVSNASEAIVRLAEDLFRSTSTLIGRVVEGSCTADQVGEDQGVAGIRVYLEDGRFAVTDEGGRFHFEGLPPGTHVAQLDPVSVPDYFDIVGCPTAPSHAGRADSQFVRLHRGSLMRADFYLQRKAAPVGHVDIEMQNVGTDSAEEVGYIVDLSGKGNIPITKLELMLLLPDGVSYKTDTLKVDGRTVANPRIAGPSMTISLPDQHGDWHREIRFAAGIDADIDGELASKAFARFDSPVESGQKTPVVETKMSRASALIENEGYVLNLRFGVLSADLTANDTLQLGMLVEEWQGVSDIHITAIGHSDSQNIAPANQDIFADNYVLSRARAMAAATYLAGALDVPARDIQVEGRGPDDPVASNATAEGRQQNRRVELILAGKRPMRPSFLEVTKAKSGTQIADTRGAVPGSEVEALAAAGVDSLDDDSGMPSSQIEPSILDLEPGVEMLLPRSDFQPAIPVTKISVKHGVEQQVVVYLNGSRVNPLNFDGMVTNVERTIAISRWVGVDLQDGQNEIRVEVRDEDGAVAQVLERSLHYAGNAIRGEIVPDMSVLVADGKTRPLLAVRLFDRAGQPARTGSIGTFRVNAPYRSWWEVEFDRKNPIVAIGGREPMYRIGAEGVAFIELEPTSQAGEALLTLNFDNDRQQELRAWLSSEPRDWILVGFAEGTVGYNTLSDNMTAAMGAGHEDGYYDDGRVAFFAKGEVKGEYLLTLAYDSARERSEQLGNFQTTVDPNAYYSLYADRSEQRFDAPSQRKLYVKLERNQFYAMFGDYDTGLSVTDLTRYERRFNGIKSEYRGEHVGYSVFATETNQAFLRDEIRGDGTSGLYRLSTAPVIGNSEQVRIEVRDRFDTAQVISSTTLSRFLDYSIDILNGTLYFKQPVPSRDPAFNPVFIVVEYESRTSATEEVIAGGRGSLRFAEDRVEVGVSYVDEGQQGAEADLTGVDLRWQMNDETLLRAESATSNRIIGGIETGADARSLTVEHQGENVDVRAYFKEVDDEFGLGLQSTAEKGMRKLGIDGRAKLSERFFFDGEASWQQNLVTDAIRNTASGQLRYEYNDFTASTAVTYAGDEFSDGETRESTLADVGVSKKFLDGGMTLRATSSIALTGEAENIDYPTTYVVGADFRVADGVDLYAEYEDATGSFIDSSMARVGVRATPWSRAQISSSLANQDTEFGPRLFANVGLIQGFQLTEHWVLDVGLDQTRTLVDANARQFDTDREPASGSLDEDFTAAFVGASYSAELWSANGRVEYRDADSEQRTSVIAGWYREPSSGHGLSAGVTVFRSESVNRSETTAADLRFGWAWRRADSPWAFLNRIDLIVESTTLTDQERDSRRIVNNFNANRRLSERSQLGLQYGFKYVLSSFDDLEFSGYTDLIGVDFRYGLNHRWDMGAHTSIYHSHESKVVDFGLGLDIGFNAMDNLWISLGYNLLGFHDDDFASARYTAQGPYLQVSIKADQHTLKSIAGQR